MRGSKVVDNLISMVGCNNNILINSNFANPVNQRGWTSTYTSASESESAYWIDRWGFSKNVANTILSISDEYVSITQKKGESSYCNLFQKVEFPEKYANKRLSISFKARVNSGGSAVIYGLKLDSSQAGMENVYLKLISDGEWHEYNVTTDVGSNCEGAFYPFILSVGNFTPVGEYNEWAKGNLKIGNLSSDTTADIAWAKVEVNDFCTPYVARLYQEELQLCKRYCQVYDVKNQVYCMDAEYLTNSIHFSIEIPEMRVAPSVRYVGANLGTNLGFYVTNISGALVSGFTFSFKACECNNRIMVTATKDSHGMSRMVFKCTSVCEDKIVLDAEL